MALADWLPRALTHRLSAQLGQAVKAVQPAAGAFASDFAGVVTLADASAVFVKASADADRRADYATEASIDMRLPTGVDTPRLRGWFDHHGWIVLWFDVITGTLPAQPWTPTGAHAVVASLPHRARLLTPCPVPALRSVPEMVGPSFQVWQDLAAGRGRALSTDGLDAWTHAHLTRLAGWEHRWPNAIAGNSLCHFDPRADNYLLDRHGHAWVLDWSRGARAAWWVDLVTFLVTLAGDGYDAEHLFHTSVTTTEIDADDVNAHLAALAGYWTNACHEFRSNRPHTVLNYQQRSGAGALTWLRQRLHD